MATLALAVAGAAVGGALLPAGVTILGATLTGAAIGSQIGALAGSFVDRALFGASGQSRALAGPRLTELRVTGASEGAPIPRLYGRARLGGQLIWATDFEEEVVSGSQSGGGKPLSPVHIRGSRTGGDLTLSWIRRTRIGGDSWDTVDVPLGEAEERYEIDILDGTAVKRTLTATAPTATYTAAQQTADFGSPQPSVSLRICQMSATRGRGTPREATV